MRASPHFLLAITLAVGLASSSQAESWKVDSAHTTVGFSVSHLFTSVQGRFDRFEGTIDFGGGPVISGGSEDVFAARLDAGGSHVWGRGYGDAGVDASV